MRIRQLMESQELSYSDFTEILDLAGQKWFPPYEYGTDKPKWADLDHVVQDAMTLLRNYLKHNYAGDPRGIKMHNSYLNLQYKARDLKTSPTTLADFEKTFAEVSQELPTALRDEAKEIFAAATKLNDVASRTEEHIGLVNSAAQRLFMLHKYAIDEANEPDNAATAKIIRAFFKSHGVPMA